MCEFVSLIDTIVRTYKSVGTLSSTQRPTASACQLRSFSETSMLSLPSSSVGTSAGAGLLSFSGGGGTIGAPEPPEPPTPARIRPLIFMNAAVAAPCAAAAAPAAVVGAPVSCARRSKSLLDFVLMASSFPVNEKGSTPSACHPAA